MSMPSKRYNITAAREYERGGETKTAWVRLGTLWVKEDGSISGVLEVAPTGNWFDGRIHAFRADDKQSEKQPSGARPKDDRPRDSRPSAPAAEFDDDIPF